MGRANKKNNEVFVRAIWKEKLEPWVLDCVDLFLKTHPNIPNFWDYPMNLSFISRINDCDVHFPNPFNSFTWMYTKEGRNFWYDVSYNEWLPFMIMYLLKKPNIETSWRNNLRRYYFRTCLESQV